MNAIAIVDQSTTPSLPEPLRRFVTGSVNGEPTCHRELTPEERADVERRRDSIRQLLTPATEDEALTLVMQLLLAFPAQELSETGAKYRANGYITALSDCPAWAIRDGCKSWLKRRFSEATDNYAFAPSPPQLERLCRLSMREAREHERRLEMILKAKPHAATETRKEVIADRLRRLEELKRALSEP